MEIQIHFHSPLKCRLEHRVYGLYRKLWSRLKKKDEISFRKYQSEIIFVTYLTNKNVLSLVFSRYHCKKFSSL